jgi:hypothetical protein
MLLHNTTFKGAIRRYGCSHLLGKRAVAQSAHARLAQFRRHQQQYTKLCALPVDQLVHDLHTHASAVYDLADAAAAAADTGSSSSSGFLSPLTDTLETVLKTIQSQLNRYNVPYSYGYSIILLTVFVKMLTLPLTKIQVSVLLSAAVEEGVQAGWEREAGHMRTSAGTGSCRAAPTSRHVCIIQCA